jgi:rubrerythrin
MTLNAAGDPGRRPFSLVDDQLDVPFGRRRFLFIGGAGIGMAALIAACGDDSAGESGIARVGNAPTTSALPAADVNDVVLLRTASSLEHTIVEMYDRVLDIGVVDPLTRQYFTEFRSRHEDHAVLFERLTEQRGGEPWRCTNPRLETVVLTPILRAITGGAATDLIPEAQPSDDPHRDVLTFAHGMESVAASTYQGLVTTLSEPGLRQESARVATDVARHSAMMALLITGTPAGYVSPQGIEDAVGGTTTTAAPSTTQDIAAPATVEDESPAPPATPIPAVYAINGQFGSLAATQIIVGSPNPETGNRVTLNLETPSLNTFVYEYMTDCEA